MNNIPWIEFVMGIATIVTTIYTVYTGNKLIAYRIDQLERKMNEFTNLNMRINNVENSVELLKSEVERFEKENNCSVIR